MSLLAHSSSAFRPLFTTTIIAFLTCENKKKKCSQRLWCVICMDGKKSDGLVVPAISLASRIMIENSLLTSRLREMMVLRFGLEYIVAWGVAVKARRPKPAQEGREEKRTAWGVRGDAASNSFWQASHAFHFVQKKRTFDCQLDRLLFYCSITLCILSTFPRPPPRAQQVLRARALSFPFQFT